MCRLRARVQEVVELILLIHNLLMDQITMGNNRLNAELAPFLHSGIECNSLLLAPLRMQFQGIYENFWEGLQFIRHGKLCP